MGTGQFLNIQITLNSQKIDTSLTLFFKLLCVAFDHVSLYPLLHELVGELS